MRHFPKEKALLICVVAILIFLAFMLLTTMNTITNVSGVEANGVGVYWDSNCTDIVSFIDWGKVTPGSEHNRTVFIRNEGDNLTTLFMNTSDWNPSNASEYMPLSWNYGGQAIGSGEAIRVTLTLSISRSISGITNFNFKIIIGTDISKKVPDLNSDGIVDIQDVSIVTEAFGSEPGDPNWDPVADVYEDGKINIKDVGIVAIHFGEHA